MVFSLIKYSIAILIAITLLSSCSGGDDIIFVKNRSTSYTIVILENADSLTQFAARELQEYIFKVSGTGINISNNWEESNKLIFIGKNLLSNSLRNELDSLKEDGFIIQADNEKIIIGGKNGKSNLYATYTFIEEFLGCRLLSATEEYIPKNKTIIIPKIKKTYQPAFSFRRALFPVLKSAKYRYWHKIETLEEWGSFVHTFQHLISPDRYFNKHPEYFSLVGKRRLRDGQLCLSNPEVINVLTENLRQEINKSPAKKYWSVSQNDCYNYCECDNCDDMYNEFGGISGAYVFMANQLARDFPDKQISTLAYQFTRSAPTNIKPDPNVNIMFCSIECNRSMPLEDDKRSAGFVKDMKDWSQLTDNFFIWDYVVQFKNYLTPFPNFHVLQPNIQFFKKYNVGMMFQQGSGGNWSDLSEMKQYLISKLLWDPYIDQDSIVDDFLKKYYGPAEPYIKSYFNLTHSVIKDNQEEEFLNIYGYPSDYFDSFLTTDLLKQYKIFMDNAEEAVKNDSIYLERVLKARLPVDFAYLDIALNKNVNEISYVEKSGDSMMISTVMIEYLNRFIEISKQTGITRINERNLQTEEYKKYVLHKLDLMLKKNLTKGKSFKLLTKQSETYPVGGAKALNDGLFGDLDFHNNWLGFQGYDMIAEIDLQKAESISQIDMNFLKAVNSWVFIPVEVIVEISLDGINYKKLGIIRGDNSDRSYLVKSVPFNFSSETVKARYLRITANSLKKCPDWHRGYGNPSWIFIDEIVVE